MYLVEEDVTNNRSDVSSVSTGGTMPAVAVWDDSQIVYPMRYATTHVTEIRPWQIKEGLDPGFRNHTRDRF